MVRIIKKHRYMLFGILILALFAFGRDAYVSGPDQLRVHYLSVGQGDSMFFETPGGIQVLIDGGPKDTVVRELARVMPFWDRTIDLVILTHPQLDHLSGIVPVLKRYEVGHIMLNGAIYRLDAYGALIEAIRANNIPVTLARAGETLKFDRGIVGEILWPRDIVHGQVFKEINESSVMLRLDHGKTSFLFTGDAGFPTETELVADHAPDIDVDILKVGHHGSKNASGGKFLRAVSPRVAVIEVGTGNTYGHPTPEALERLAAVGATVFRTDTDNTVTIISDGSRVSRELPAACPLFCLPRTQMLFEE